MDDFKTKLENYEISKSTLYNPENLDLVKEELILLKLSRTLIGYPIYVVKMSLWNLFTNHQKISFKKRPNKTNKQENNHRGISFL